jgi:hypothetical protein
MIKKVLFGIVFLLFLVVANASAVTIVDESDLFTSDTSDIGDFAAIAGFDGKSSPGSLNLEVLGGPSGGLQSDGIEWENRELYMMDLWNTLNAGGVISANALVFGFGLNEDSSKNVQIDELTISFQRPGGWTDSFSLGQEPINIYNFGSGGANTAEGRIQVNLDFDFMTEYDATSTEQFAISSTISNTSGGFEIYFLSSSFTLDPPVVPPGGSTIGEPPIDDPPTGEPPTEEPPAWWPPTEKPDSGESPPHPTPEPTTMLLLSSGLLGLAGFGRRFKKS